MFVSVETHTPVYSAPTENEETYRHTVLMSVKPHNFWQGASVRDQRCPRVHWVRYRTFWVCCELWLDKQWEV